MQDLFSHYSEPFRYYHNLHHIADLLRLLAERPEVNVLSTSDRHQLYLAILYHDVIFNIPSSTAGSNEELSARQYENDYKHMVANVEGWDEAPRIIRATEHHFDGTLYDSYIINLMLDFDIFSFTLPYEDFKRTNTNLDLELAYAFTPSEVNSKRLNFMQSILDGHTLRYRVLSNKEELTNLAYTNIQRYVSEKHLELGF